MKPDKLCTFEVQWWDRHWIDIIILKGRNWEAEGDNSYQSSLKPSKKITTRLLRVENNPVWFNNLPFGSNGAMSPLLWLCRMGIAPPRLQKTTVWLVETKAMVFPFETKEAFLMISELLLGSLFPYLEELSCS